VLALADGETNALADSDGLPVPVRLVDHDGDAEALALAETVASTLALGLHCRTMRPRPTCWRWGLPTARPSRWA
jgi:hypothetical protein